MFVKIVKMSMHTKHIAEFREMFDDDYDMDDY